jgi:hypothetical protein
VENLGREKSKRKTEPGRFAEGPRQPRLILPASAVSEQETRKNFSTRCKKLAEAGAPNSCKKLVRNKLFKIPQKKDAKIRRIFSPQNLAVSRREAGNSPSVQNSISPAKLYFSSSPRRNS